MEEIPKWHVFCCSMYIYRLADLGHHVGFRMIDILCLREKTAKRETRLVNMLWFIQKTVWKVTSLYRVHDLHIGVGRIL